MITLCCTRFNTQTWDENKRWRENKKYTGCLYTTPVKIKSSIPLLTTIIVIEMQNDYNKILGIGLVSNYIHTKEICKVYNDGNYNRYVYKSLYRIDEIEFNTEERKYINILEPLLFKGSRHCKRGQGITSIPLWIANNSHFDFIHFIKKMFHERFSKTLDSNMFIETERIDE